MSEDSAEFPKASADIPPFDWVFAHDLIPISLRAKIRNEVQIAAISYRTFANSGDLEAANRGITLATDLIHALLAEHTRHETG